MQAGDLSAYNEGGERDDPGLPGQQVSEEPLRSRPRLPRGAAAEICSGRANLKHTNSMAWLASITRHM